MLSFGIKHTLWDTTISGVYHSFQSHSSNTFRKLRKAGKRFVQLQCTIFHQSPKKHFYRLENHSKLTFFFPPHFQTIMGKSLGTWHFCISGVFSNSHKSNPSPHPTNNIGCNISKTHASGFIRGSKHQETDESGRVLLLYCFFPKRNKKICSDTFFCYCPPQIKEH